MVQRDNTYYLNRDYLGYHNDNGAIFLDMGCDLTGNPKALILYGHNMKTGAMFGNLRNMRPTAISVPTPSSPVIRSTKRGISWSLPRCA